MAGFLSEQKRINKFVFSEFEDIIYELKDINDKILNEISRNYAKYLVNVEPKEYYGEMIKFKRLGKLQEKVKAFYQKAYKEDAANVLKTLEMIMKDSYNAHGFLFEFFSPVDFKFHKINQELVDYSLRGSPDLWKKLKNKIENLEAYTPRVDSLSNLIKDNLDKEIIKIRKTINNMFLSGQTLAEAYETIESKLSTSSLKRIFVTESNRLYNIGSYSAAKETGLEMSKAWLSTLDTKTRRKHGSLDGEKISLEGFFKIGDDEALLPGQFAKAENNIYCRCTVLYNIPGVESTQRRGKNPVTGEDQLFSWRSYEQWRKELK